jgi:hypothetical protein
MLKRVIIFTLGISLFFCIENVKAENMLKSTQFSKESGWDYYVQKDSMDAGSSAGFDNGKAIIHCAEKAQAIPTRIQVTRKNLILDPDKKYIVRFKAEISKQATIEFACRRDEEKMQVFFWSIIPGKTDYQFTLAIKNLSGTKEKLSGILFFFLGGLTGNTLTIWDISIIDADSQEAVAEKIIKPEAIIGDVVYSVAGDFWPGWAAKPSSCKKIMNGSKSGKYVQIDAAGDGESGELGNRDVLGKVAHSKSTSFTMTAGVCEKLEKYKGYEIEIEVGVKAEDIPADTKPWEGVCISANYSTSTYNYNHCYYNDLTKTFDWRNITYRTRIPADMTNMSLTLGLIANAGKVAFDHLKITITDIPFSMKNVPAGQLYKGHNLTRLRGFGTGIREPGNESGKKSISTLGKDWNANVAVLWFGEKGSFAENDAALDKWMGSVEESLKTARDTGVYLILKFGTSWSNPKHGGNHLYYENPEYANKFVEQWKKVAARFKGRKEIYALELLNESKIRMPIADGCTDYPGLMERAAKAINEIDPERSIIVQPEEWWSTRAFYKLRPLAAKNIIYAVHFYSPFEVSHQGVDEFMDQQTSWKSYRYPGICNGKKWDKEALRRDLQPVIDFQKACNAHIFVDEFSCIRWALGDSRDRLIKDMIEIFEELGWDWSYHAYPEWPGWDPALGTDPWNQSRPAVPTQTEILLKSWFKKNEKPVF